MVRACLAQLVTLVAHETQHVWWMMSLRPPLMLGCLVDVEVYTLTDAVYTWRMLYTLMDVPIRIDIINKTRII